MKLYMRATILALLVVVTVLLPFAGEQNPVSAQTPTQRTITVTGTGSAYAPPDTAYLSVGVEIIDPNPAKAVKDAETKMNAIVKTVKAAGVTDSDIQTEQYNIFRDNAYNNPAGNSTPVYHLINTVRVTVENTQQVGDILGAAVNAGANVVNNVSFGIKDTKASEATARTAALEDAKNRATELAKATGGTLGQILAIAENGSFIPPIGLKTAFSGGGGGGGGGIAGGALQITISVTVSYEIK